MNKLNPLKFGIIGCSRIAKKSVIPGILKSKFAEVEIIGSRTPKKSKEFSNEFNCKKFGTYDDIISDKSVDAIYISTPIGTHEEWAIKAASAGKHVYCEKSSTSSFESAQRMIECAKQNNVRMMEGFMFRFHPQHEKIIKLIGENQIGNIISFSSHFGFPAFPKGDIRYQKELGGGFLNDSGCYPICASRMIFDEEPIGVSCDMSIDKNSGVDLKGMSLMKYEDGKTALLSYGNGNYYQAKYDVWGEKGIISSNRAYSVPSDFLTKIDIQYSTENNWDSRKNEVYEIKPTDHFVRMIDDFCLEITDEKRSSFNFEKELLSQAKVMEAHRMSFKEKKFINIDEIN